MSHNKKTNTKTNPKKKWMRPDRYYCKYEKSRKAEGRRVRLGIGTLRKHLQDILKPKCIRDWHDLSYMLCLLDKSFRVHSYRTHVTYMETNPGSVTMYGLKKIPGKSALQDDTVKRLADNMKFLEEQMLAQAANDSGGTLLGDSSGFSIDLLRNYKQNLINCNSLEF